MLRSKKYNDIDVTVYPEGRIDISNSQTLKEDLMEFYRDGFTNVVIDFGKISSIDSSGLGKLLLFHKKLKETDGKLKLVNIKSDYVKKMFKMIHLNKVIEIEGME